MHKTATCSLFVWIALGDNEAPHSCACKLGGLRSTLVPSMCRRQLLSCKLEAPAAGLNGHCSRQQRCWQDRGTSASAGTGSIATHPACTSEDKQMIVCSVHSRTLVVHGSLPSSATNSLPLVLHALCALGCLCIAEMVCGSWQHPRNMLTLQHELVPDHDEVWQAFLAVAQSSATYAVCMHAQCN
jgi:hypothetical protein